jgi:tRNA (uracil-5-)-methyltransferase TRM9
MQATTAARLLSLNLQFYQTFGKAFAETRRRVQPGVRRALELIPPSGRWLDLGCGPGTLAVEWIRHAQVRRQGEYLGLDFSPQLLEEARQAVQGLSQPGLQIHFQPADLSNPGWEKAVAGQPFDGVLAFAVLHHLPGANLRRQVLRQVHELLSPGGCFIHSEWQFQHSPKLMARRLPWDRIGLKEEDLEEGDTLLDWRHALVGQAERAGLRYVHLFSRPELADLAAQSGFVIEREYDSDGEGGRLGLYQVWRRV